MRIRLLLFTVLALFAAACSDTADDAATTPDVVADAEAGDSDNGDDGDDASSETAAGEDTETAADDAEPDATDEPAVEETAEEPEPIPCPAPPVVPTLEPIAGAERFPGEGSGLPAGRYGSTELGVSFAVDVPDAFDDAGSLGDGIGLFGPFDSSANANSIFAVLRPEGLQATALTEEDRELGVSPELVDLSAWLAETGVEITSDQSGTVDGKPARFVRVLVSDAEVNTDFDDLTLTPRLGMLPGDFEQLLVEIELGGTDPLLILAASPDSEFAAVAQAMIDSFTIGDFGERSGVVFAETPWDIGNVFRPRPVGACTIPAVAFGGVTFDLSAPALLQGSGEELWIFEPSGRHVGFLEPFVNIVSPEFTATGGDVRPPSPGEPVLSIEDAIAEFEAEGFELTPLGDVSPLLGSPAVGFAFEIASRDPWLWFPFSHDFSPGFGFNSDQGQWQGVMHLAVVDGRVIIVSAGGEIDTEDVDLVRPYFDDVVASLTAAG